MADSIVPIFRVKDGHKASEWYKRLGFKVVGEHRFAPTMPLYLFLDRNGIELHLSEHTGDAAGPALVYFWVDSGLEQVSEEFGTAVEQQPWAKEVKLEDPDGNRLRIAQRNTGTT